jgi:imidazolonepropionase-like amidohydrolase
MPEISELFPHAAHRIAPIFILTVLASPGVGRAQLLERATVIRNARVIVEPGRVIENASILIKGEKIEAVGNDVRAPFLSQAFDASGKTVTTGLIDAWSGLGRLGGSDQADPTSDAWDAFDRYARDDFREALRNGVTTVYVGPGSGPGIGGAGVIVQLAPEGAQAAGELLSRSVALRINLASNQSAVSRMKTFDEVRKQFRKALDYRQALEDYEVDVKEYLDKLKERREKKEAKDKPKEAGDKKEAGEKKDAKSKEDKPPADKPKPSPEDQNPGINAGAPNGAEQTMLSMMSAEAFKSGDDKKNDKPGDKGDKKEGDKKEGEKKDGDKLTKPARPAPDRKSEAILRAIDHKLPVRVEAHRSEDILNALALAGEFNLDMVIEGATDAYLVADKLAEANTPIVLGPVLRSGVFENNEYRRHSERNAAVLEKAGVLWTAGSGAGDALSSRFAGFNAQLAAAFGGGVSWLETETTRAAKVLGMGDQLGRVEVGRRADLVIWTGDPGDPASKVERVFVAGKPAYVAPEVKGP